ncbi:MAG TPA: RagB/SusD family nutrient uptake outer membrane protein [Longimicrobiales bacterium]|nr:RagB/SusD family nutrient uptake outer membrane protein [Longimicrobiales bacterium]
MNSIFASRPLARAIRLGAVAAAVVAVAACDKILDVNNPGALEAPKLNNPTYIDLMANGVVGEFQQMTHWDWIYAAKFSGEVTNHHVYFEEGDIGRRDIGDPSSNGTYQLAVYNPLHRVRWLADSVTSRIKALEGDSAGRDLRLARVLAYAGYSYVYIGEQLCASPINTGPLKTSDEILAMAPPRFDEAIKVAAAAKTWALGQPSNAAMQRYIAGADSITNFARVGAARASLDLNKKAEAIAYASAVTPAWTSDASAATRGFQFWAPFLDASVNNRWWQVAAQASGGGSREVGLDGTMFDGISDPRVPQQRLTVSDGTNGGGTPPGVNVPKSSEAFSTYDGTLVGAEITKSAALRLASAIEARYILAEAQGKNAANIDFVNNRRAVAGMAPLPPTVDDVTYRNALIEQRARELFLDGHRLGDIRRYKKNYGLDFYLHGPYPASSTLQYGSLECFPLTLSEVQGNPNLGS